MREIREIRCSCGGKAEETETTKEEEELFGCGRPGCCVTAYQCRACNTRFTIALEAPELEDF